ncbi:hypothetical protein EVA_03106 [gut metagenome]|uniref:Uncharacterized protein n=1 Tax=gut metagenome TaxID=749906 RepID=J9H4L7_9ZZZZ
MLETSRVSRVTCDRYIYTFFPHDSNTFANVVSAIAFYLSTRTVRVSDFTNYFQFTCEIVKLSLNICKSVDTRDDLSSVFTQTIQDATQRFFTYFISFCSDFDSTFSSSKRFVTCQESETFSFFAQQHSSQVTVTDANLTVVSYRTRNTERLQTDTNCFSSISSICATFLQSDSSTYYISPLCVFETDRLSFFTSFIRIETIRFADSISFFDVFNTVFVQRS